ncbi:hypothetical protein HO710_02395 [Streptococcus suis]|nr:hypothetical protein [Streptococcus suis]
MNFCSLFLIITNQQKTIRYIFTKNIENVKKTDFKLTFADYPELNKATDNGTYTFTSSYAGKEYSYSRNNK